MQGGGPVSKGFNTSGSAMLVVGILLAASFTAVVTVPGADAQRDAPWWGPADRQAPTEGWGFRVPVVVTNDRDVGIRDPVVAVEIDFGRLLTESGWINQTHGADVRPRGFTLDEDSLRVIEYDRGFRNVKGDGEPVPHVFYPALFEESMRGRSFNPSTYPVGTLTWRLDGPNPADAVRYYHVYFNAKQYGDLPPPEFAPREAAAVHAYAAAGAGNVFYGYANGAPGAANRLDVLALFDGTEVTFSEFTGGAFRPLERVGSQMNPAFMNGTFQNTLSYSVPPYTFYKVESNHPILVSERGRAYQPPGGDVTFGAGAFAMAAENARQGGDSLGATFAGTTFTIPLYAPRVHVIATETGATQVSTQAPGGFPFPQNDCSNARLTGSNPSCTIRSNVNPDFLTWVTITADKPVLVQYGGPGGNLHQVPARSGAPTGTDFVMQTRPEDAIRVLAESDARLVAMDPRSPADLVHPPGSAGATDHATVGAGCTGGLDLRHVEDQFPDLPYLAMSVDEAGTVTGPLHVAAGGPYASNAAFFTGNGGRHVFATGPVALIGHYDETRVSVIQCDRDGGNVQFRNVTLAKEAVNNFDFRGVPADTRFELRASKPFTAVSILEQDSYARYVPGRLANFDVDVRPLEFRGPLVDLRSPDARGTSVTKTTGPGTPVDTPFTVVNLGRWIGGESFPDDIVITCAVDREWEVDGCDESFALSSFQTARFDVTVTPASDAETRETGIVTVTASSAAAPGMRVSMQIQVTVIETFDVGMWFDVEGGRRSIDPPVSVNPGESYTYTIVMKNLGTVTDVFQVLPFWATRDAPGWEATLHRGSEEMRAGDRDPLRISLAPGATETLRLTVTADEDPEQRRAPRLTVQATSTQDPTAVAEVNALTQIRADIRFEIGIDAPTKLTRPGEVVNFTVTLENSGEDMARIDLTTAGDLPEGWTSRLTWPDGEPVQSVNLNFGTTVDLTLGVRPTDDALSGALGALRVGAETMVGAEVRRDEVSATVVVRQVHVLDLPDLAEEEALPGATLAYTLLLENAGNGPESVEILTQTVRPAWRLVNLGDGVVDVPHEGSTAVDVALTVPEATEAGAYEVTFALRLGRSVTQNVTIPIVVPEVRQFAFDEPVPVRVTPGQAWRFPIEVRNTGNVHEPADLAVDTPPGWTARLATEDGAFRVDPAPGRTVRVDLVVNATTDAPDGAFNVTFRALFENGDESSSEGRVTVGRPALYVGTAEALSEPGRGGTLIVHAPVGNAGEMDARDVRVALVVNGEIVDVVTLSLIRANQEQLAVLSWEVNARMDDVKVIVNPEGRIVDAVTDGAKEVAVQFASSSLVPAPAPVLLVALAALGALLARGRWRR